MQVKQLKIVRAVIIVFYTACLLFLIYILVKDPINNDIYHFVLHSSEKFHCPACGLTRAVYSLATFQFKKAFYYHAFFTVTSPFLAYVIITLTVNLFCNKKVIPYPKNYALYLYIYLGLYVAFAILRNFTQVIF